MEEVNLVIEAEDEKGEKNWVIEIEHDLKSMENTETEKERWMKRSIYLLPACVTDLNKKAYKPQVVSFGPYHHGEDHLKPMEDDKHRALLHFLKRSKKPFELFVNSLASVVQDLKDSYDFLDPKWQNDTSRFLELMILDGCFMLEILRMGAQTWNYENDYAPNDPIFSNHGKLYIMPYIRRDMLMLENQLPMLVLDKLVEVESNQKHVEDEDESMNKLILKFWFPNKPERIGKCLHVLDVYRKSLLRDPPKKPGTSTKLPHDGEGSDEIIRSATELHEAGIRFKKSKTDSLKDISFKGGILELPQIVVDDATEFIFLNLIAFERFHVGAGNDVTSYIFFMDNILDSARDVSLLHAKGIVQNALGSDKGIANLFNSISKDIALDPESKLDVVHRQVSYYCKQRWNKWRANLVHTYFTNPWAILSVVAAISLFALTIIQTIYTVCSYYQPSN